MLMKNDLGAKRPKEEEIENREQENEEGWELLGRYDTD